MNKYYNSKSKAAGACSFGGAATIQSAQNPSGTCSQLLSEAGAAGTGVVTSTNGIVSGGSGAPGASGSKSAASGPMGSWGDVRITLAVIAGFLGGAILVIV